MRFWGLFLFSFLSPPMPKMFFPPELGAGCSLSACGLTLTPRTEVTSGVTCPNRVESWRSH